MTYFLFKSEPDVYSFDDFLRDGETVWDGVTNPTAVKNLREMKPGTKWIFYHTGDERTAVGTGTVLSVDAADPKSPSCASRQASASSIRKLSPKSKPKSFLQARRCCSSAASPSFRSPKSSGIGFGNKSA